MNRNMRATIHHSATTYSVRNSISDTLPSCPLIYLSPTSMASNLTSAAVLPTFIRDGPSLGRVFGCLANDDGLVAALYSPCEVRTMVRNTEVHSLEETEYPFRGSVRIKIEPAIALSFPQRLGIPGWASVPVIAIRPLIFPGVGQTRLVCSRNPPPLSTLALASQDAPSREN
ncbi:MAG: hypothetical protein WCD57_26400 [Acidobacteriaceae bacterium]